MSHFSFTRSAYDNCAIEKKDQESTAPFNWVTDNTIAESKNVCFESTSPFMQNPFRSVPSSAIDVESDLRGQKFSMSKCPTHKFNPEKAEKINTNINECKDNGLIPQYTRINKSCNIFSGININRFHPLCEDLQQVNKIHNNSFIGKNTRLEIKDAFKDKQETKRPNYNFKFDVKNNCESGKFRCSNLIYPENN
jgi:hypothetical protein